MITNPSLWLSEHAPRWLLIALVVGLIALVTGCILVAPSLRLTTGMLLTPPSYRNSWIVLERMSGGTGGMRRTVVSATTDPIAKVVAVLDQQLPGFQPTTIYRNGKILPSAYRNYQCNDTPVTIWLRRYFSAIRTNYCVSVILYPDSITTNGTILETEVSPVSTAPNP